MIIIKDRTDLDPAGRKLYSVQYDNDFYWAYPVNNLHYWLVIKDNTEDCEYNRYHVRNRKKFVCTCKASIRGPSCRHIAIVREIIKES